MIMLYNSWQLSFCTVCRRDTQTSWILLCKSLQLYQLLFAKSSATVVHSVPTFECVVCLKNAHLELSSVCSEHFSSHPISLSAYPKCMPTPMLSKIAKLFYMASTLLCCRLVINQINLFEISTKPSDKNIPKISYIPNQKIIHQALLKYWGIYIPVGNTVLKQSSSIWHWFRIIWRISSNLSAGFIAQCSLTLKNNLHTRMPGAETERYHSPHPAVGGDVRSLLLSRSRRDRERRTGRSRKTTTEGAWNGSASSRLDRRTG